MRSKPRRDRELVDAWALDLSLDKMLKREPRTFANSPIYNRWKKNKQDENSEQQSKEKNGFSCKSLL